MTLVQWSEKYSVGVRSLDRHHRKLFELLNRLHEAMSAGKASKVVTGIIGELLDYTSYHFEAEERLMSEISYLGLTEHRKAHQEFVYEVKKYKEMADDGMTAFLGTVLLNFLRDWLIRHIGGMDKKYRKSMNDSGIR